MFKFVLNLITGSLMGGILQGLAKDFVKDLGKKIFKDEKGSILLIVGIILTIPYLFYTALTNTQLEWCQKYVIYIYAVLIPIIIIYAIYRQKTVTDTIDESHEDEFTKIVNLLREYTNKAQLKKFLRLANSYKYDEIIEIELKINKIEDTTKYEYIAIVKSKENSKKQRTITYNEINN